MMFCAHSTFTVFLTIGVGVAFGILLVEQFFVAAEGLSEDEPETKPGKGHRQLKPAFVDFGLTPCLDNCLETTMWRARELPA
jgi:hypothetical protein